MLDSEVRLCMSSQSFKTMKFYLSICMELVWDCLNVDSSLVMVKFYRFSFLVYSLPGFHIDLV